MSEGAGFWTTIVGGVAAIVTTIKVVIEIWDRFAAKRESNSAASSSVESSQSSNATAPRRNADGWSGVYAAGTRRTLKVKGVDFAFRYCPAGTFLMGSPSYEAELSNDETRHEVMLTRGFWFLETPVTQGMFRAIAGSNPSYFKSGDNYPVESVSWFDCNEFCESLNALGVAPAGFEFRLPREAEWEYACRAGTTGAYNVDGQPLDALGWYGGNSGGETRAVGVKRANAWGLYDMHGNVLEWCADWCEDYPAEPQTDPTGPTSGSLRVLRGGSWCLNAEDCRSAYRVYGDPTSRYYIYGFRLVLGRKL